MPMIAAFALLLACQLAGEVLRGLTHAPVPGPVMGMVLLACALLARPKRNALLARGSGSAPGAPALPDTPALPAASPPAALTSALDAVSGRLIASMGLLFVPAGVGIIAQADLLRAQWLPIVAGLAGSTLIGLLVTALVMHWLLPPHHEAPHTEPPQTGPEA